MAIEKVKSYFEKYNMEQRILELETYAKPLSWVNVCKNWAL
jgi:hypothetical protein